MSLWCLVPILILYFSASALYIAVSFFRPRFLEKGRRYRVEDWAFGLSLFGVVLHGGSILYDLYALGSAFLGSMGNLFSLLSFGSVLVFFGMIWRHRWQALGAFFLPMALMLFLLSLSASQTTSRIVLYPIGKHPALLFTHVFCAMAAFLLMLGAFVLGIAFRVQERRLKSKAWDPLTAPMPPLLLGEKKARFWLRLGWVFLTVVLITGSSLMGRQGIGSLRNALHILLALTAWSLYAIVLNRRFSGFQGGKMLLLSFIGFVSLFLVYLWN